jgi:hypothetical protein
MCAQGVTLSLSLSLIPTGAVVMYRAFFDFLLHKSHHKYKKKSFSGEVKDSVIFSFFLLHKRAKPILPPYTHPSAL